MTETKTKQNAIRKLCIVGLLLIASLIQSRVLPVPGGMRVYWLMPMTVIVAMFEKELPGALFGMLAGVLWDIGSAGSTDGVMAFVLTAVGFICGALTRYILRNNLLTATVLNGAVTVVYTLLYWGIQVAPNGTGAGRVFLSFYLPQILLTVVSAVPLYILIRTVEKKFRLQPYTI